MINRSAINARVVGQRHSSSISQEFLKNVLEKVKETANRKATSPLRNNVRRNRSNDGKPVRMQAQKSSHRRTGPRDFKKGADRLQNPMINATIVNNQPQFAKKSGKTAFASNSSKDSVFDAMDSLVKDRKVGSRGSQSAAARIERKRTKTVPGLTKRQNNGVPQHILKQPSFQVSENYAPEDPTPLSLLKYSPRFANSSSSRKIGFGLNLLKQSNFPLYRSLNMGISGAKDGEIMNLSLAPSSKSFGMYAPFAPVAFTKEKLSKNIFVQPNVEEFKASVGGDYETLETLSKESFDTLTKNQDKKLELARNAQIVKLSLEKSNMDFLTQQKIHKVCSGLKPLSEL
ncbi:LAMI_0B06436g1_1 [Lachancea mirantina]|uniref:LAMI_0B06436g1_1 n=1 Tax=Lachancea mirantina TaxID=1230905 RepID=A0A1G4IWR7_9SACH|nr:LAMI_0B06436g1_1 [Lachancea mirantina]